MFYLKWTKIASEDLLTIINFIANDNVDSAQRFKNEIELKITRLIDFPEMGRYGRVTNTRELIIWGNYIVVYQITPPMITLLRILHAAQHRPVEPVNRLN